MNALKETNAPEEKEIVWLPQSIAKKFNALKSIEEMRVLTRDVIERKRLDMTTEDRNLEDDVLRFKAFCLAHRSELSKVYNEECDLIEQMWEELSGKADATRSKIKGMAKEVNDFSRSVGDLKKQLGSLEVYQAERFLELANTVNNMDESTKDILRNVLNASQAK